MMCCLIFIYYVIIYPTNIFAKELQVQELYTDEARNVTDCVIKVIDQINWEKLTIDISIINVNDMLVIPALRRISGVRFLSRSFHWHTNTTSADINVIMSYNYKELEQGLNLAAADFFWNTKVKFILVIGDLKEQLSNVTHLLLSHNILNVTVLGKVNDDHVIYTFNSESDSCNRPKTLELVSKCSQINHVSIFKMRPFIGFRGCAINVVIHNSWPFVNYDYINDSVYRIGLEQYIFKLFEEHYGIKIKLVEFVQIDRFEKVIRNISYSTILDKLRLNEFEAAIGGFTLLSNGKYSNYSFTYPLVIDDMALIVRRKELLRMWQAVLKRNFMTIIMFSIMFVIFSFIVIVMALFPRKERDVILDILIVLGYFLEKTSVNVIRPGISSTLFFMSLLLLVFIIPYVLQAYLVSVTTHPVRVEQQKDTEEIYKNFQGIIYTEWRDKDLMKDLWVCGTQLECLSTVATSNDDLLYTMVSTTTYESYAWKLTDERCALKLYKISDPFVMLPRTFYFRRGSIFVKSFDKFFMNMMGGGLLTNYKNNFIFGQRIKCRAVYRPVHVSQKLHDYEDVFIVLIVGYCLSTAVFIFEYNFKK